jgi:hypothetical protein
MRRGDTSGRGRGGALLAALVGFACDVAIPLLPIWGDGHQFFWETLPESARTRLLSAHLVGVWGSALAVLFGIVMLRRYRSAVAAGVFAAVAIVVAGAAVSNAIHASNLFGHAQTVLVLGLQILETLALAVAASIAVRRWT